MEDCNERRVESSQLIARLGGASSLISTKFGIGHLKGSKPRAIRRWRTRVPCLQSQWEDMARRRVSKLAKSEQPISWVRAFLSGIGGVSVMMGFIDISFSCWAIRHFLSSNTWGACCGARFTGSRIGSWVSSPTGWWAVSLASCTAGHLNMSSGAPEGESVRLWGLDMPLFAAVAVFPFFAILQDQAHTGLYPDFGFFGVGLGAPTPILLLMGHLLFGMTVGLFYGPVRAYRVRARVYEPGESAGLPGELEVITSREKSYGLEFRFILRGRERVYAAGCPFSLLWTCSIRKGRISSTGPG